MRAPIHAPTVCAHPPCVHPPCARPCLQIGASENVVRYRIARRAAITGRSVPDHLIVASLASVASSLEILTPLVDFVARVGNDGAVPLLRAYIRVDSRGHWGVLQHQFARPEDAGQFPLSLAPIHLAEAPTDLVELVGAYMGGTQRLKLCATHRELQAVAAALRTNSLELSPLHEITLHAEARALAGVPHAAATFAFSYPAAIDWDQLGASGAYDTYRESVLTSAPCLVPLAGAFVYFDEGGRVCAINAVSELAYSDASQLDQPLSESRMIQFAQPIPLPESAQVHLGSRLKPVTLASLLAHGAEFFVWILPGERLPGVQHPPEGGAFAYIFKEEGLSGIPGARAIYFPVAT